MINDYIPYKGVTYIKGLTVNTLSPLLTICTGETPVIMGFPQKGPVMWSFDFLLLLKSLNSYFTGELGCINSYVTLISHLFSCCDAELYNGCAIWGIKFRVPSWHPLKGIQSTLKKLTQDCFLQKEAKVCVSDAIVIEGSKFKWCFLLWKMSKW